VLGKFERLDSGEVERIRGLRSVSVWLGGTNEVVWAMCGVVGDLGIE
jgi:hypothetical protein